MEHEILAQYTELYETYVENGNEEYSELWNMFPTFTLDNLHLSMYQMFYDKYKIREIGAETEQLFSIFYKAKLEQMLIKYVPKLNVFISQWNNLFNRKITLINNGSNTYYLNPMTSNMNNLKIDDMDSFQNVQEKPLSMFGKTNAELMKQVIELKDIFNDCLEEFNTLFIGLY